MIKALLFAQAATAPATAAGAALPDPHSYQALGWVFAGIVAFAGGALVILQLVRELRKPSGPEQVKVLPNPLEIAFAEEFVTKEQCTRSHENTGRDLAQAKLEIKEIREMVTSEQKELTNKVGELAAAVEGLKANSSQHNARLAEMSMKFDQVITGFLKRRGVEDRS